MLILAMRLGKERDTVLSSTFDNKGEIYVDFIL